MTTTINASTSSGIVATADGSGILKVQSNGVTTNALSWVNFNGTSGATAARASYNVSSVTRNSIGDYTIAFTVALSDANYTALGVCAYTNAIVAGNTMRGFTPQSYATSSIRFVVTDGGSGVDPLYCNVAIFGN